MKLKSSSSGIGDATRVALGPRDTVLEKTIAAQRSARAQRNMEEALFFFLPLAILLIVTDKADGFGMLGAQLFLIARVIYLPSYLMGVFALRSIVWTAGSVSLILMIIRLIG